MVVEIRDGPLCCQWVDRVLLEEDWRTGGLEDWRTGGLEDWRTGGLEDSPGVRIVVA